MRFFDIARHFASPLIRIIWPTKIYNKNNAKRIDGKPVMYICNHFSVMDSNIILTRLIKKNFRAIVKKEAFEINEFVRRFLHSMYCIPIDRENVSIKTMRLILNEIKSGNSILIYPEGTRNKGDYRILREFKEGAAWLAIMAKVDIIPMLYYRKSNYFKKNYLIVGDRIKHDDPKIKESKNKVETLNNIMYNSMLSLRPEIESLVDGKKLKLTTIKNK